MDTPTWTAYEDEQIRAQYPKTPVLAGHAPNSVRDRGRELGLQYPDVYGDSVAELVDYSGRKYVTLWWYANKHGVTIREAADYYAAVGGLGKDRWTELEDDVLRDNANRGADYVSSLLPGRGVTSVRKRAQKLGVSLDYWTQERTQQLCELYCMGDDEALSNAFPEYRLTTLKQKAQKLGAQRSLCLSLIKSGIVARAVTVGAYTLVRCATCKKTVLLRNDELAGFKHGPTCEEREFELIPEYVVDCELRYKLNTWDSVADTSPLEELD